MEFALAGFMVGGGAMSGGLTSAKPNFINEERLDG